MSEDLQHAQQRLRLDQIDSDINALSGKAATDSERFAVLELRVDALQGRLALASGGLEGKAVSGMSGWVEKCFCHLIEEITGRGPADGHGRLVGESLLADGRDFNWSMELIRGERQPVNQRETVALSLFRAAAPEWAP